jgi:GNAT superfamily N-acetyltransferase
LVDEREARARHRASFRAFLELLGSGSPGARLVVRDDGVVHSVCPASPGRSVPNSVTYDDAAALPAALPELAALYDEAGIGAWTVWTRPGDEAAASACAAAGHVLDATPEQMWAPLPELDLEPVAGIELDEAPPWPLVGELNDAAYGLPPDSLAVSVDGLDPVRCLRTVARLDGRPVATATVNVVGEDAHVLLVATLPEARGRGLAAACMRNVLARALERGATTTTLEATQLGRPVYRRMGYRELGAMGMWERRRAAAAG